MEVHPAEQGFVLWVRIAAAELDHASLRLAALVARPPAPARLMPLERKPAGLWKLAVPAPSGLVEIELDLKGNYLNGKEFTLRTQAIRVVPPVTEVETVNLDLDGRPLLRPRTAGAVPAAGVPADRVAPGPVAERPPSGRLPDAAGEPESVPAARVPGWLAGLAAILNLALGLSVWWLVGAPRRGTAHEGVARLRALVGLDDAAHGPADPASRGAAAGA